MASKSTVILGTGHYAPARILTNDELAKTVETSDEWIRTRSGIRERRIAAPDESTSDMAVAAAKAALADAGLTAADIDLLIVATVTPDLPLPAAACIIQHKLGIPTHAAAISAGVICAGVFQVSPRTRTSRLSRESRTQTATRLLWMLKTHCAATHAARKTASSSSSRTLMHPGGGRRRLDFGLAMPDDCAG